MIRRLRNDKAKVMTETTCHMYNAAFSWSRLPIRHVSIFFFSARSLELEAILPPFSVKTSEKAVRMFCAVCRISYTAIECDIHVPAE